MSDKNNNKYYFLKVIVLATLFGLAGGITGDLVSRIYLFSNYYSLPFWGELDLSRQNRNGGLIIRDAKKVIVDQNTKIDETIKSAGASLVGIYKKIEPEPLPGAAKAKNSSSGLTENSAAGSQDGRAFNLNNFYQLNKPLGQGFIITSDGWIVTSWQMEPGGETASVKERNRAADYVVISQDKKILTMDKYIPDKFTGFNFIHVQANDLPVKKFVEPAEVKNGNLVLAVNWFGHSWLATIADREASAALPISRLSDSFNEEIALVEQPSEIFKGGILFNLAGEAVAMIDNNLKIIPISQFNGAINSLLKFKLIKRPQLGVSYLDLTQFINQSGIEPKNQPAGALIYHDKSGSAVAKNSPAARAGLRAGDIIVQIDNVQVDQENSLTYLVQNHAAGDKISLSYLRGSETKEADIVLGELK